MLIKDIIRNRRKELGLTQEYVGDALGVTKQTISKYENGTITDLSYDVIVKLAKVLQISPASFFDNNIDKNDMNVVTVKNGELTKFDALPAEAKEELIAFIQYLTHKYKIQ